MATKPDRDTWHSVVSLTLLTPWASCSCSYASLAIRVLVTMNARPRRPQPTDGRLKAKRDQKAATLPTTTTTTTTSRGLVTIQKFQDHNQRPATLAGLDRYASGSLGAFKPHVIADWDPSFPRMDGGRAQTKGWQRRERPNPQWPGSAIANSP